MENHLFEQFNFQPFINEAIRELRFYKPTAIQERIIPAALRGESVIGQSQTGTGKTHAFLLPLIERIDPTKDEVQAVIAAPTRELATQIYHEVQKVVKHSETEFNVRLFVGGTDKQRTIDKLKRQPQIVIGTPARINDLVKENALLAYTAQTLVIDEADLMLDMGFMVDVDQFASKMPEGLQILVFSATIPEKLKPFLKKYLENPKFAHVEPQQVSARNIEHQLIPTRHRDKIDTLEEVMKAYNPYLGIIFTNTKKTADYVANVLNERGHNVGRLHGDLPPRERKKMMKQILDLEFRYIVATDLAARGIDIPGVSHVINFEIPKELEFFIHRIGRTARAGNEGVAACLFDTSDHDSLEKLEKMGIKFVHGEIVKGEFVAKGDWKGRKSRQKVATTKTATIEDRAKQKVKRSNKVKPGYKKKYKQEVDKVKQKLRRQDSRKRGPK